MAGDDNESVVKRLDAMLALVVLQLKSGSNPPTEAELLLLFEKAGLDSAEIGVLVGKTGIQVSKGLYSAKHRKK